jgi:hypothetical protein
MLALIVVPTLSVWFLLRPGYSNGLRIAAFTYTIVLLAVALAGRLL